MRSATPGYTIGRSLRGMSVRTPGPWKSASAKALVPGRREQRAGCRSPCPSLD